MTSQTLQSFITASSLLIMPAQMSGHVIGSSYELGSQYFCKSGNSLVLMLVWKALALFMLVCVSVFVAHSIPACSASSIAHSDALESRIAHVGIWVQVDCRGKGVTSDKGALGVVSTRFVAGGVTIGFAAGVFMSGSCISSSLNGPGRVLWIIPPSMITLCDWKILCLVGSYKQ